MKKTFKFIILMIINFLCFAFLTGLFASSNNFETVHAGNYEINCNNKGQLKGTGTTLSIVTSGDTIAMRCQYEGFTISIFLDGDDNLKQSVNYDLQTATYTVEKDCKVNLETTATYCYVKLTSIYSVEYNYNGGSGSTLPTSKLSVGEVITLDSGSNLSRNNYKFIGWSLNSDATTGTVGNYTIKSNDIKNNKITFYAVWECNGYSITYNSNDATSGTVPTDSTIYAKNASITVLGNTGNLDKTGYIFDGWNTDSDYNYGDDYAVGSTYKMGENNVTLYAKWVPAYTISYNVNGGTGTAPTDTNKYKNEAQVTLASTDGLTKTGYHIVGWSCNNSATFQDCISSPYTLSDFDATAGVVTLYAVWESDEYCSTHHKQMSYVLTGSNNSQHILFCDTCSIQYGTAEAHDTNGEFNSCSKCGCHSITYVLDGGTNGNNANYYLSNSVTTFLNATKVGYAFDGWYTDSEFKSSDMITATDEYCCTDLTLYAKFDLCTDHSFDSTTHKCSKCNTQGYSISFDDSVIGDSVTNMPTDSNFYTQGTLVTIPTTNPIRNGYIFLGWNTDSNATTALTFNNGKYTIGTSNVTFYAVWIEQITVSHNISDNTFFYNGLSHTFNYTLSKVIIGVTVKYAEHSDITHPDSDWSTTTPIDAGIYDVKVYKENVIDTTISSALIINQFEVTLSWSNTNQNYSGNEIKPTCVVSYLVSGDECEVTVTGGKIEIGQNYVATATSLSNNNYKLPSNVTQNFDIDLPIEVTNSTYNKKQQGVSLTVSDSIKNTFTFEYKLSTEDDSKYTQIKPVNAGIYDVRITRAASAEYNAYSVIKTGYLVIAKKNLTYSWTNTKVIYDGNEHIPSANITNLEDGDVCNITVTGAQTAANEQSYEAIVESCDNTNYSVSNNNKIGFHIYPETLYYNYKIGKFVYINEDETKFVASTFEDNYSVSPDKQTITLKNFNHVLDYNCDAFYIDSRVTIAKNVVITVPLTIVLEGTNNIGCSTSGKYGFILIGDITIKGDGVLNVSGCLFNDSLMEVQNNVLNIEGGTINIETINDIENENRISFNAESRLNITGGKITVSNPLKINRLFKFKESNFILYAAADKNSTLSIINELDSAEEEGTYQSTITKLGNKTSYYYAEFLPLIITQSPSGENDFTIKTNIDANYQWFINKPYEIDLLQSDVDYEYIEESFTDDFGETCSYDQETGWKITGESIVLIVTLMPTNYSRVVFTTNKKLSLDFEHNEIYKEAEYDQLEFIKKEGDIYYYSSGFIYEADTPMFFCCLEDEEDEGIEINNLAFYLDYSEIEDANTASYSTPAETGKYYVEVKNSFAKVKTDNINAVTVSFDANGGTGSVSSLIKFEGSIITLNDGSGLSNSNKTFNGWNTDKDATEAISNTYTVPNTDVTLYAIWSDKYIISINQDTQYFNVESDSNDIKFNITGTNIPTSGLTITYRSAESVGGEFLSNPFSSIVGAQYYNVKITYTEDETYKGLDLIIPGGIALYTSVIYHDTDATGGSVPVDDTKYIYSTLNLKTTPVKPNSNNLVRTGYVFDGWYYCNSGILNASQINSIKEDGMINLSQNKNIHVYPNWKLDLKEISKTNDYTVKSDADLSNCTYQWCVGSSYKMSNLQFTDNYDEMAAGTKDYYCSAGLAILYEAEFYFNIKYYKPGCCLKVSLDKGLSSIATKEGDYYILPFATSTVGEDYFSITLNYDSEDDNDYSTITDFEIVFNKDLTGETSSKVGNVAQGQEAYCVVSYAQSVHGFNINKSTKTNGVQVKEVKFDGNGSNSGSVNSLYYLEGRTVSLPTNTYSKTDNTFVGWNTDKTATTKLSTYTMGESDTTMYAIWAEKAVVSITETAQEETFNSTNGFKLSGTDKDLTGFEVKYYVNDAWTTTVPINVGKYNVKITRAADDSYKAYEKEINEGYKINALTNMNITLSNHDNITITYGDSFTEPTSSTDYPSLNSYITFGKDYYRIIDFATEQFTLVNEIKDVGEYLIRYSATSNTDNIKLIDADFIIVTVNPKEITIDWCNDNYTYNGQEQTITASYKDLNNQVVDLTVSVNDFKNAGSYTATVSFKNNETNYKLPTVVSKSYTINKLKVNEPTISVSSFVYDGLEKEVTLSGVESFMTKSNDSITKATAKDTYTITYTLDSNHEWNNGSDGIISWSIVGSQAVITVDTTPIVITFGDTIVIPDATSNFGKVTCDKVATDLVNAGTYTITYSVTGTNDYSGDTKTISVTINKANAVITVDQSTITKKFGETVVLPNATSNFGTVSCDKVASDLVNPGVYTVTYSVAGTDNYNGDSKTLTVIIKSLSITPKDNDGNSQTQQVVIVGNDDGFDTNVEVTVEVTVETEVVAATESNKLSVNYYNLNNEQLKLNKKEKVGVVFDVKLVMTVGDNKQVIQPSDIKEGTIINVKMLIPDNIDVSKVTRILHVHSADDIESIDFDESKIDAEGYYEISVTKFSEFAFIYEDDSVSAGGVIAIILVILLVLFIGLYFVWKYEIKYFKENSINLDERKLQFADPVYKPIDELINKIILKNK